MSNLHPLRTLEEMKGFLNLPTMLTAIGEHRVQQSMTPKVMMMPRPPEMITMDRYSNLTTLSSILKMFNSWSISPVQMVMARTTGSPIIAKKKLISRTNKAVGILTEGSDCLVLVNLLHIDVVEWLAEVVHANEEVPKYIRIQVIMLEKD